VCFLYFNFDWQVHWRTAALIELGIQKHSPLRPVAEFPVDRSQTFRRTTDPVSADAQRTLDLVSKL
jgi:hypothetical protein